MNIKDITEPLAIVIRDIAALIFVVVIILIVLICVFIFVGKPDIHDAIKNRIAPVPECVENINRSLLVLDVAPIYHTSSFTCEFINAINNH